MIMIKTHLLNIIFISRVRLKFTTIQVKIYKKLTKPQGCVISFKANRLLANIIPFLFKKRDCRKLRDIEIFKKSFNRPLQEPFWKL